MEHLVGFVGAGAAVAPLAVQGTYFPLEVPQVVGLDMAGALLVQDGNCSRHLLLQEARSCCFGNLTVAYLYFFSEKKCFLKLFYNKIIIMINQDR